MIDLTSDKIRTDIIRRKFKSKTVFRDLNITKSDYKERLQKYLIELSDGYYYAKTVNEKELCNEIVGRYLCRKISLQTTTLELLLDQKTLKLITPNYKKKSKVYVTPEDDINMVCSKELRVDKLFSLSDNYQEEQLKLIAIDMMMEQTDRYSFNMEEIFEGHIKHLAPIIDFAMSFDFSNKYHNPYVNIPKNVVSIDRFLNIFPNAYDYICSMFSTDTEELIHYIEENYPIKVSKSTEESYQEIIANNKLILSKIK